MKESDWQRLKTTFEKQEEGREQVVVLSRQAIQLSKKAIFAAQRGDLKEAAEGVEQMRPLLAKIRGIAKGASVDAYNSLKVAEQEYVEAACLVAVLQERPLPSHSRLGVSPENYLLGLCDLVGELGRVGVHGIIKGDYQRALGLQSMVHDLYGKFMHLNLRNGELRKKVDGVKWELKKMEDVILQLKVQGRL